MTEYNINSQLTLLERAKRSTDGKRILPLLDVMDKMGVPGFLQDVPYIQANMGLKHRVIRTTSRPSSTRRKFYGGVSPSVQTTQIIYEDLLLFEQRLEIDEDHLDTIENPKEYRGQEVKAKIAGILEDFVYAIFNDDKASGVEYIDGFKKRLSTLSYPGHGTTSLPYVWDGGGSTTLTSMYLVDYGPRSVHALFPSGNTVKGSMLGVIARNKGKEPIADTDDSTATYYAYVTQLKKWCGMAVHDDRKLTRIANVNATLGGTGSFNENILIQALNHGRFNKASTRLYVNPYVQTQIDIRAKDKGNVQLSMQNVFGESVMTFLHIPIRMLDETIIGIAESQLS